MKKLLALFLVAVMAGSAMADCPPDFDQDCDNTLALFFSPSDAGWDGGCTTNANVLTTSGWSGPFGWAYLVLLQPSIPDVFYIEFGFKSEAWVEGWMAPHIYFGTIGVDLFTNVDGAGGYSAMWIWPNGIPVDQMGGTVLARFRLLNWVPDPSDIEMGPMRHLSPSIEGKMSIIGASDDFHVLTQPVHPDEIGEDGYATVATFFGDGVVATEDRTLSSVKSLFQ